MFMPKQVKQWQCKTVVLGGEGAPVVSTKQVILSMIEAMIGFPLNPWVVEYSCDSITAGVPGDGINRWLTPDNIVSAADGSAHSWIVLSQPALGPNFQMMINWINASLFSCRLNFTFDQPFLGGTTTNSPTAVNQTITPYNSSSPFSFNGYGERMYFQQSVDGECFRVFFTKQGQHVTTAGTINAQSSGNITKWVFIEKIENHGPLQSNPIYIDWGNNKYTFDNAGVIEVAYQDSSSINVNAISDFWKSRNTFTFTKELLYAGSPRRIIGSQFDLGFAQNERYGNILIFEDSFGDYWIRIWTYLIPWSSDLPFL